MTFDKSELNSISSTLEDLTSRVSQLAKTIAEDDESLVEILEVERQIQTASRRLIKIANK